ncbi:MAG: recombinase family protein [Oscillospiraceae bacterium]|nr:recombinase family protein [Oscillospiraceae bacterium]
MKTISKIELHPTALPRKKRVAAYARVSKETERLLHSVSEQVSYYNDLIQRNPEWEFAGIFADSGISGTRMEHRTEFQKLMQECENGNVDLILCKSISRFARNTALLLNTVRHLKEIGVEVRFEKENISTFSGDGELLLSLLASFAQEESRSISENVKWGIRKRFQAGTIGTANKHILGYRYDAQQDKYVIVPEEAETVRWMFQMYLNGISLRNIAENMNNAGCRSTLGNEFSEGSVRQLIFNEIYAGDLLRQKYVTSDPITKQKVTNRGELPQYLFTDCHEAILDRETYTKVQAEMERRAAMLNPVYFFTGKIRCEICGKIYTRKKQNKNGRTYTHWICRSKKEKDVTCTSVNFREDELMNACMETVGEDYEERIIEMCISPTGDIHFTLTGGEKLTWTHPPKPIKMPKPAPEKKRPKHLFDGMIFCGICGRRYGRAISQTKDKHLLWRCRSKTAGSQTCDSVNYADPEIRDIYCKVFDVSEFNEAFFKSTVTKIVIQKTGSIDFHTIDGDIRHYETLKLRDNRSDNTCTDAFIGKVRCAHCGNLYRKYTIRGKYTYWVCQGKRLVHTECSAGDISDSNLRRISAYVLGLDEFESNAFTEQIEYIHAFTDGSLEYHFIDGRTIKWQRM